MDDGRAGDVRLLSPEAIVRTLTPVSELTGMGTDARAPTGFSNLSTYYGQLAVLYVDSAGAEDARPAVIGHSGSDGTFAWAWPELDLMVLYFTQSRGGISGLSLERWIDELLIHPDQKRLPAADRRELYDEVVGEYLADYGSVRDTTLRVLLSNDRPAIDLGRGRVIELRDPDDEGRWYFSISGSTAVSFTRNKDGVIDALRMHEGGWDFEAPRKGVPIAPDMDEAELQKYLGTYHVQQVDADITVLVHNHRLSLDKSSLPGNRPTDLFELYPPRDDGRWVYRINKKLHAEFDEESNGTIPGFRIFNDGKLIARAVRTVEDTTPLPGVEEIMALRNAAGNAKIIAGLGGVLMKGKITFAQSGMTGESTAYCLGTDRYRSEIKLAHGSVVEVLNADGARSKYFAQEFVHEGKYLEQARNGHPLLPFLDWRENLETVEVVARKTEQGREVFVVRTTDGETSPVVLHVDVRSGDVLMSETVYLAVTGDVRVRTSYEDYRVVGGLRFPHRITSRTQMNGEIIQEVEKIELQQEFSEELFAL